MKLTETDKSKVQRVTLLALISAGPALAVSFGLWWIFWQDAAQNDLAGGLARAIAPYIAAFLACGSLSSLKPHTSKEDIDAAQLCLLAFAVAGVVIAGGLLETPLLAALIVGGALGSNSALRIMRDRSAAQVFKLS